MLRLLPFLVEKKTIIFDLDETLVHCVDDYELDSPQIVLEIDFPETQEIAKVRLR